MRAQFVASEMIIGVRRNISMILSVVLAVAVSLFLVGFALLVRDQVDRAKGYWYDKVQVSVFLCGGGNVPTPKSAWGRCRRRTGTPRPAPCRTSSPWPGRPGRAPAGRTRRGTATPQRPARPTGSC